MDTIVLAGGYAQRLWPLTEDYPKTLLPIAGKPTLHHVLESVAAIGGVGNIVVAIDAKQLDDFRPVLETLKHETDIDIQLSSHKQRGDAGIKSPLEKLEEIFSDRRRFGMSSDTVLVVGADNVFGFPLSRFIEHQRTKRSSAIAIHRQPQIRDASEFGIPVLDSRGRLAAFSEKPQEIATHNLVSTACYLLRYADAELVSEYLQKPDSDTLGSYIRWLNSRAEIDGFVFDEPWFDMGTRAGLLCANSYLLRSDAKYHRPPTFVSGRIKLRDFVHVAERVVIEDSTIGPNVYIGTGSRIIRSTVVNSIVYESSTLENCEMQDSVVGRGSRVEGRISEAVFGPDSRISRL